MTRIFIIRHAEAEGNLFRRIHGHYDSTVTYKGLRQIKALKDRFAGEQIDACYSSDLVRTRTTAASVWQPKHLPLRCDPRLREVHLGEWEDVPFGQLDQEQPEMLLRFNQDPYHWHVAGGEDYLIYSGRFLQALEEIARLHDGETVALFSHGCVIRSVQQRLFYTPESIHEVGHCDNTGVSLLEYDQGSYRKVYLNDASHLTDELSTFARQRWWRDTDGRSDTNLWFRPMKDEVRYLLDRKDAWQTVYGGLEGFDGPAFFRDACHEAIGAPDALCDVMLHSEPVGVIQLAPDRFADRKIGYIPFLYLKPELRGRELGIQLIGHAVSFFRKRGRTHLQICVSPNNRRAMAFYRKYGFQEVGSMPGRFGNLIQMDYNMDLQRDVPALSTV